MSMALALEYLQVWFRLKKSWAPNQCGVQYQALPAADAGRFYVAFDDASVATGQPSTDSLREELTITVGIWRRPEHFQHDRVGKMKMPTDLYLAGVYTLHKLERAIIVHGARSGLDGLHNNYAFMNDLNTYFGLPHATEGAEFRMPLCYRGRSGMESIALDVGKGEPDAFMGYRLRFSGLYREQRLRDATTQALG